MRNWYKASIRSKSVKNTKLIESIECFFACFFSTSPNLALKKNAFECYISREKKKKENKRIGIKTKESGFRPYNKQPITIQ